jgi:hypothetical protein
MNIGKIVLKLSFAMKYMRSTRRDIEPFLEGLDREEKKSVLKTSLSSIILLNKVAELLDERIGEKKIYLSKLVGICARVYDDIFDMEHPEDAERISKRLSRVFLGEYVKPECMREDITVNVYERIREIHPSTQNTNFYATLLRLHNVQIESIKQRRKEVSKEELETITKNKGAYNLLLYSYMVKQVLSENEEEAVKKLGFCFQLADDFDDREKDLERRIYTLANHPATRDYYGTKRRVIDVIDREVADITVFDKGVNKFVRFMKDAFI